MFDIFKQDIKVGDKVKLYLTTGKEPEGIVITIGDNFVLLQANDNKQNRFFDKLIGGWDVLHSINEKIIVPLENQDNELSKVGINQNFLIEQAKLLKASLYKNALSRFIEPNSNIIEARGTTCIASNQEYPKILILNSRIADDKLISNLETFEVGSIIPVVISIYDKKGEIIVDAVALPNTFEGFIDSFIEQLYKNDFERANLLLSIIRNEIKFNKHIGAIINELKKIYKSPKHKEPRKIQIANTSDFEAKRVFKNVEKEINDLIRHSKFEFALAQIEKELINSSIEDKYKSSLLLKKAQIYSSVNKPEKSEQAYQELVLFNEKIKAPSNNLSHLYTELARLQSLNIDKQVQAKESVKKALSYNPNNNFALNLLQQLEGRGNKVEFEISSKTTADEHLLIDADDDTTAISKMIGIDIKEHKYTNSEIIRNGGKPTAFLAKLILEEAKKTREGDLSERYPIYLEAAKAFSELNVGSYDLQDYLEAVAYYSMLKGNSIFINFRNNVLSNDFDILKLMRLRDSACSYYIESLNLLSNIDPILLLTILANYLKLNLSIYHIQNQSVVDFKLIFKGQFADVFTSCLKNKNKEIESIAYLTILSVGASSILAWNELGKLDKGTSRLYLEFRNEINKKRIYELLNNLNHSSVDTSFQPKEYLKNLFLNKKKDEESLQNKIGLLSSIDFEPTSFEELYSRFTSLETDDYLLTETDKETKSEIAKTISILQPYLNRGQSERTNILIQARNIIEKQISFINDNTTFYGRTFFYGLLNKWKKEIDFLLEERISQSYPSLEIIIDPPYFIETDGVITAPLVIKNVGEATANGFSLNITCESTEFEDKIEFPFEKEIEIAAENKIETNFVIPQHLLSESTAVEIKIEIQAIYQNKKLTSKFFEFTVEEEPKSILTYDDIPWRDGPIPPEQMFKGRKKLIADLAQHYLSIERDKPYILYGLTRTGKSSVLEYLKKNIEGDNFYSNGQEKTIITFSWDLSEAASFKKASDFWRYILYQQTFEEIEKNSAKYSLDISELKINENTRAKDFKIILGFLQSKRFYPVFFVDEFSFIKTLIDDGTINAAFLHTLRQFSLTDLASFIFAGTYDIKSLIKDPKYGITGQLVNAIEEQINEISDDAAEELIEVINDKLSFTPEAIEHIKFLSGNVPYFIQIICKYCGYFASENKRRFIGYPELEKVIKILIGQVPSSQNSLVKKLPENVFQNNQFSPADPKEVAVLISSLTYLNKDRIADPRGIGFAELQKLWAEKNITAYRPKLADAINLLKEKKIIIQGDDEGIPVYTLTVDLFRRWWSSHNPDINLTLTTLTE